MRVFCFISLNGIHHRKVSIEDIFLNLNVFNVLVYKIYFPWFFFLTDDDEFPIPGAHYIHNNQSENINNSLKNEYNNFSDVLKGVQLPCEFCEKMIDSENLVLHEVNYI